MIKKIQLLLFFLIIQNICFSQNIEKVIDSLKRELKITTQENVRAKIYGDLTWYYSRVSTDSALIYGEKAINLSKKIKDSVLLAQSLSDFAVVHYSKGEYKIANQYFNQSLKIREVLKDSSGIASLHYKIGNVFYQTTQMDSAMTYYFKALRFYDNNKMELLVNSLQSNIGAVHMNQKNYPKAIEYFNKNISFFEKNKQTDLLVNALINKASVLLATNDTIAAIENLERSILLGKEINSYAALGSAFNNLGTIYSNQKKYALAKSSILESIKYRKNTGLNTELASSMLTLAGIYNLEGDFNKAKPLLLKSLKQFQDENIEEKMALTYLQLIPVYANSAKPDSVSYYTNLYIQNQEKTFSSEVLNITNELETRYQTEKKENEILAQRAQLAEKDLEVERKNTIIFGAFGLAIIFGLIGYLFFNQQKLKNRQLKKESELKTALAKIETQNRLQEQRLRISRDLHDNIGAQLTFIISSIDNIKYGFTDISEKLTNKLSSISVFTSQTIYELRDTIWAMNKNNITFEDLQTRITNFIEKAKIASEKTNFVFVIDPEIDENKEFSSVEGMNIYRIIQEAVNNAIKYADASKIEVHISEKVNNYIIEIKDNGKGFVASDIEMGNGLNNIKKRVRELEGDVEIISENDKGTTIKVSFKNS